jgi:hypothetical protein
MSSANSMLTLAETVQPLPECGRGPYRVNENDVARVLLLRGACIAAAWSRSTYRYGDLAALIGIPPQGMGRYLDLLWEDCTRRDEPSLAALVVKGDTGQCAEDFVGEPSSERERCYGYWLQHRGRR